MGRTVVEEIVTSIAQDILRGVYAPGERLPAYRKLATKYGVTLPTAQRAVGRVDELGLVEVVHGSGATVLDPRQHAHPGVLSYWVKAVLDQPQQARAIVEDFLGVRAELAALLVSKLIGLDLSRIEAAVDELEARVVAEAGVEQIMRADTEVIRAMFWTAPSVALATVFNAFAALLEQIPQLARAMYIEPMLNVTAYRTLLSMIPEADPAMLRAALPSLLGALDVTTADRFEKILEEER